MSSALSGESDPVVVAGLAVEAPGGIEDLDEFWSALAASEELIGPFPRDREWPLRELFALHRREGWGSVADAGGFLTGATEFDPQFFGITPREAVAMDPQQRVALRVAWRAVEHAGINPATLAGSDVGVFIGGSVNEYGPQAGAVNDYSGYRAVGTALGALSGRISHVLGLMGPSVTVDTACASSLTAVHQATTAIRAGECEWALAGGVCVMGSPGAFYEFAKNNALSTDGHLRAYSAGATGTVWGEGAGVVVLERESRARAEGHRVHGRILATRINHNGRGAPIAVPNTHAQEKLIRATIAAAGIPAELVELIEGHGTGTRVGDPLELTALRNTYGAAATNSPRLGSVKANLGHAQAAAGILGLIKVLLCGAHGRIAPTLHSENPATDIDWEATGLRLATDLEPWPAHAGSRYAAVSSFGVAGTNAHTIIAMPADDDLTSHHSLEDDDA